MKLKIEDVLSANTGLAQIAQAKMPASTGIKLARVMKVVAAEARTAGEALDKLLPEHGTPTADRPGAYSIPVERQAAYLAAVKDVHATEIEIAFEVVELPAALEVAPAALLAAGEFVRVREE